MARREAGAYPTVRNRRPNGPTRREAAAGKPIRDGSAPKLLKLSLSGDLASYLGTSAPASTTLLRYCSTS